MLENRSDECDAVLLASTAHLFWPDRRLCLAYVSLVEQDHAETALANTSAYGERERAFEESLVEIELYAIFLACKLELSQECFLIDTDTH